MSAKPITALFLILIAALPIIIAAQRYCVGEQDFIAFWAGAKCALSGCNPYNFSELSAFYQAHQIAPHLHQYFLSPPWSIAMLAPFTLFSFKNASALFFILNLILLAGCFELTRRIGSKRAHNSRDSFWVDLFTLVSFTPLLFALVLGQLSLLVLFALLQHLLWARDESKRAQLLSAFFLSLTLIKPQILHLYYVYYAANSLRTYGLRPTLYLSLFFSASLFASLILQPALLADLSAYSIPSFTHTPTLGAWLAYLFVDYPSLRYLPLIAAQSLLVPYYFKKPLEPVTILTVLVPLSVLSSPYAWTYDFVLLLPLYLYCARELNQLTRFGSALCFIFLWAPAIAIPLLSKFMFEQIWFAIYGAVLGAWFNYKQAKSFATAS